MTRQVYARYFRMIDGALSTAPGADVELGAGRGGFVEYRPGTLGCDLIPCPWLHCAADAAHLPFADGAVANLVLIDVLHHLPDALAFFDQADRVLAPGGRILLIEPYVSPVSALAWRFFCNEDLHVDANPFDPRCPTPGTDRADPWSANTAIPTLLFWRHLGSFYQRFPRLRVVRRRRLDTLVMPLSGGLTKPRLIPLFLAPLAGRMERWMTPLEGLLAFRCFVVLERVPELDVPS